LVQQVRPVLKVPRERQVLLDQPARVVLPAQQDQMDQQDQLVYQVLQESRERLGPLDLMVNQDRQDQKDELVHPVLQGVQDQQELQVSLEPQGQQGLLVTRGW